MALGFYCQPKSILRLDILDLDFGLDNQFIHEEISMLFCSEKFYGGGGG